MKPRARELGIPFDGNCGKYNAITDVPGVEVGYSTITADSPTTPEKNIRTGVTVVLPRGKDKTPVFGASSVLNGNGEVTGLAWLEESGFIENPIGLTNTHSVGTVRDSIVEWVLKHDLFIPTKYNVYWSMPIVGETWDGRLNDCNGQHVKKEHVWEALTNAKSGPIAEGNIGGGTGMVLHHFKGGTCTASRVLSKSEGGYTVGALIQANHGERRNLTIAGVPVGKEMTENMPTYLTQPREELGSVIVIIATNAPLLPHQLKKLCRRIPIGLGKLGSYGANSSGDIFLAFSTANQNAFQRTGVSSNVEMLSNDDIDPLYEATIQVVEEALVNCLCAAETMTGFQNTTVWSMDTQHCLSLLKKYNRI